MLFNFFWCNFKFRFLRTCIISCSSNAAGVLKAVRLCTSVIVFSSNLPYGATPSDFFQLFKGKLYYCDGPETKNVLNKTDCLKDGRNKWRNRKYNFDSLGQALMALFVLSSKDGWVQIMYTGLDAVDVDQQVGRGRSQSCFSAFLSRLGLGLSRFVDNVMCADKRVWQAVKHRQHQTTCMLCAIRKRPG